MTLEINKNTETKVSGFFNRLGLCFESITIESNFIQKTGLLLFYNLVTFPYREWTCNIKFVSSLGANVLIIKQKSLCNFVIKPMHRRQRQLRENKLMRLYPFVSPISNVITLKLFLELSIWSSETNVHSLSVLLDVSMKNA